MTPLYNIGISLYALAVRIVSGRNEKARKMLEGRSESMARVREFRRRHGDGPVVWIHASSLGEFEQGRPLIEMLRERRRDLRIVLTFFSPSGYEVRKDYDKVDAVCYLPFDRKGEMERFIEALDPMAAIFVKYEFWGNCLEVLKKRGVPVYLISGIFRPTQSFFKWWGGTFRKMLGCFTKFYVQNEASRELLAGLGLTNVRVAGDTRLDRVIDIKERSEADADIDRFAAGGEPILVAGSSWPADEAVYMPWLKSRGDVKAIVAPHEFDAARLERLKEELGEGAMLLSDYRKAHGAEAEGVRYLIVDCFGLLASIYRYAAVAYVGGGFGAGIHNINEAAVWSTPVIFGPNNRKFKEAADLQAAGGGFEVKSGEELERAAGRMIDDPAARAKAGKAAGDYIMTSRGATAGIYADIFERRR